MNSLELDLNEFLSSQEPSLVRLLGGNIALRLTPAARPAWVYFDPAMIRQFVTALVEHARESLPGGGVVEVTAEHIDVDETHARIQKGARRGEFVRLTVADNGLGFGTERLQKLLEQPAAGRSGQGLALSVVAGMLQRQRGWLEAVSQTGVGTEFRIYLPKASPGSRCQAEPMKETILLVDDEEAIRRMVKSVLQRASYEVIEAESGVAALSLWETNQAQVNLLLTDMVMPELNGRELAQKLKRAKPGLRVIYTSGYELEPAALRDTREGGVGFLQKPYDMRRLLETVQAALNGKAPSLPAATARLAV